MSIETVLTLALAAAILVAAALLRMIVLGLLRLLFKLSGTEVFWLAPSESPSSERRSRRPLAAPALAGARRLGARLESRLFDRRPRRRPPGRAAPNGGGWLWARRPEGLLTPDPRRRLAKPVVNRTRSLGTGLVYVLATAGTWMRAGGVRVADAAGSAYRTLEPRVRVNAREAGRELTAAGRKIASLTVIAVATAQHLVRSIAARLRDLSDRRPARYPGPDEPAEDRVIVLDRDLDRDWDPLVDPLDDEPASHVH